MRFAGATFEKGKPRGRLHTEGYATLHNADGGRYLIDPKLIPVYTPGPASVYAAARPFLPPSHIVLQPFAMVSDGGVRTCVPKRLYDAFTAAFSEEYLGALYTLGSCGSPYTNWVYNYSGRRADNLIRAVSAAVPASRLRLFPFWVRPS